MLRRIWPLAAATLLVVVSPADAQYFGRNKVQYDGLDVRILETPHFDIYYSPTEHEAVVQVGRLAERWYTRLSGTLGHTFRERQPIVIYASHAQFTETTIVPGLLGDGIGGLTDHQKGRVVLPFSAGLGETDHVLGHELVHAFQRDILRRGRQSISTLPLWFVEGMAEYLSIGRIDSTTAMWLRDAVQQDRLPTIRQLDDPHWFPYRYGQALWAYLASRFGEDVVARTLRARAKGGATGMISRTTGVATARLSQDWRAWIKEQMGVVSREPAAVPAPLISRRNGGILNVGPALSPDGSSLVFLSERDQYSIDVFLADATTGAIRRRLVSTAGNPHFETLQFIESAGAWDSTGRRFALAALHDGRPIITILSMPDGAVEREVQFPELDQIFNPTWSPDGTRIAFAALRSGLSDLYTFDLERGALDRLTDDAFADLHPAWSPDGRTIAFSTDRFASSVASLTFGSYQLGAIDVASRTISNLPALETGKNIEPQWSADGRSLYFISDGEGVSNVYEATIASGEVSQVTRVSTGVSGVTGLSPALSFAPMAGRLAFTVYRGGAYEIHVVETPRSPLRPAIVSAAAVTAAVAPSRSREAGSRRDPIAPADFRLLDGGQFTVKPYRRGLSLDGIGQPYVSAGGGSIGGFLRAGVSLTFGNMMGDRQLQTAIQVGKSASDFAAQAAYLNVGSRWNWALVGGQVPWLVGGSRTSGGSSSENGGRTITRESVLLRQTHRQLAGLAIYPFSRTKRIEARAGVHAISFDRETRTNVYSVETRRLIDQSQAHGRAAAPATLVESGFALVHDTAVFGPTSPILGERYRLEVAPTFGQLTFATLTADYRKYLMPVRPFTVALRLKHEGRFGAGSGDPRLPPLIWTLRDVVRGYDLGALSARACAGVDRADCASLEYLRAHRLAVANAELRFPIIGAFRGDARYGPLPIEGLVFADAGTFWMRSVLDPGASRTVLASVGAGIRLNAAGLVFELDGARRLAAPQHGWTFAFNVRPGF